MRGPTMRSMRPSSSFRNHIASTSPSPGTIHRASWAGRSTRRPFVQLRLDGEVGPGSQRDRPGEEPGAGQIPTHTPSRSAPRIRRGTAVRGLGGEGGSYIGLPLRGTEDSAPRTRTPSPGLRRHRTFCMRMFVAFPPAMARTPETSYFRNPTMRPSRKITWTTLALPIVIPDGNRSVPLVP